MNRTPFSDLMEFVIARRRSYLAPILLILLVLGLLLFLVQGSPAAPFVYSFF